MTDRSTVCINGLRANALAATTMLLIQYCFGLAVIRSARIGAVPFVALATAGLAAIVVAWLSGSRFVGHIDNGISLTMGIATAGALLSYTLIIFVGGGRR